MFGQGKCDTKADCETSMLIDALHLSKEQAIKTTAELKNKKLWDTLPENIKAILTAKMNEIEVKQEDATPF